MTPTQDQAARLYDTGRKMREAQRVYFGIRSSEALRTSKELERQFDALLKECREKEQGRLL